MPKVKEMLPRLPPQHLSTLAFLMQHLARLAVNAEKNKMTIQNLAVVFAPNVVRSKDEVPFFPYAKTCVC